MKKVLITLAGAAALVGATAAPAAAVMAPVPCFNQWYIGVGINGTSGLTEDRYNLNDNTGNYYYTEKLDKSRIGWTIFAGYRNTKHFGTELGFVYIGKRDYKMTYTTPNTSYKYNTKEPKAWVIYYDGILSMPITQYFAVFVKGGVHYMDLDDTQKYYNSAGTVINKYTENLRTFGVNFGGGIAFMYNQFGARLVYTDYQTLTHYQKDNWLVPNTYGLDVFYCFG
jgi:opacity protein-like surface antigen